MVDLGDFGLSKGCSSLGLDVVYGFESQSTFAIRGRLREEPPPYVASFFFEVGVCDEAIGSLQGVPGDEPETCRQQVSMCTRRSLK